MAKVVLQREWSDGDTLTIVVKVDASYPDALAEAKATAINTYRDALGITLADPEQS